MKRGLLLSGLLISAILMGCAAPTEDPIDSSADELTGNVGSYFLPTTYPGSQCNVYSALLACTISVQTSAFKGTIPKDAQFLKSYVIPSSLTTCKYLCSYRY